MSRYKKDTIKSRTKTYSFIVSIVFIGLLGRLYYLQVFNNENLTLQAVKQRSIEINLGMKRGTIFDRNLIPLTNAETVKTLISPKDLLLKNNKILEEIQKNTSLSMEEIKELLNKNAKLVQIPLNKSLKLENNNIFIVDMIKRYSSTNLLSHVIGYINKAENTGESGLEKTYDEFLNKYDKNSLYVEYTQDKNLVLGTSYYVDNLVSSEEPAGIKLTIDFEIQKIIEKILDEKETKGSVIVAHVDTGEVLGLASRPNFDQDNIEKYFHRKDMALYNKGIQVSYPPGSIFKIVVLLAALKEDINILNNEFYCEGFEQINNTIINCNKTHGHITLEDGFSKSCNSVFIQLGKEIGANKVVEMAKVLGFGEKINIGLMEETKGILPEGKELLGPAIGNISIGQGKIETTPLQITNMILTIANNGVKKHMSIVKEITSKNGRFIKSYNKLDDERILTKELCLIAKEMLEEVVNSGTAKGMKIEELGGAGGKTGTAEGLLNGNPTVYGWFTGYFPKDDPEYVITVLVEDANSGSLSAAPIFEQISKEIFILNK